MKIEVVYSTRNPLAKKFARALDPSAVRNAATFGTAASVVGTRRVAVQLQQLLRRKGLAVSDETYSCKARMWFFNREKPDEDDLKRAADFARAAAKEAGPRARK